MSATLEDILTDISLEIDYSATIPASSDGEYMRRLKLVNVFERRWARANKYKWLELRNTASLITVVGTSTVDLPSDLAPRNLVVSGSGTLRIDGTDYTLVEASDVGTYTTSSRICWITADFSTGTRVYKLNIQPTPTEAKSFDIIYYSSNLAVSSAGSGMAVMADVTDVTKCPDSEYLSQSVLAVLYASDDEGGKSGLAMDKAAVVLEDMMASEDIGSVNQINEIPVVAEQAGYPNIGE